MHLTTSGPSASEPASRLSTRTPCKVPRPFGSGSWPTRESSASSSARRKLARGPSTRRSSTTTRPSTASRGASGSKSWTTFAGTERRAPSDASTWPSRQGIRRRASSTLLFSTPLSRRYGSAPPKAWLFRRPTPPSPSSWPTRGSRRQAGSGPTRPPFDTSPQLEGRRGGKGVKAPSSPSQTMDQSSATSAASPWRRWRAAAKSAAVTVTPGVMASRPRSSCTASSGSRS